MLMHNCSYYMRFFMQHTGLTRHGMLNGNVMVSGIIFVPHRPNVCQLWSFKCKKGSIMIEAMVLEM